MDLEIKHLIILLVTAIAVIGLLWLSYYLLMKTPIGKGLNGFLGGVGAVLGAVGAQLSTCGKSGFFDVDKGCWLGVAGIGIGVLWAGSTAFGFFWKNPRIDKTAELRGESSADTAARMGKELGEQGLNNPDLEVNDAAMRKILNRKTANDLNEELAKSNLSPEDLKSISEEAKAQYEAENSSINEGLTEEEQNATDDTANDFQPEPEFVE
jgi:hypothetical protein